MPITIKQGLMKYKNGQNEYIGINTVGETSSAQQIANINQAGATQVAAVNTAGSTQVSAVNTKGQEVLASIPSDYTALSDEVSELKDAIDTLEPKVSDLEINKADAIINTASGAIASFSDGADDLPVKELTVAIEPVQDLHGYDHPWPAGGGKNKFDISKQETFVRANDWKITNNGDGSITVVLNANTSIGNKKLSELCPGLMLGEIYTLSAVTTGSNAYIYLYGDNQTWVFGQKRTITQTMLDSTVLWYASGANTTATISKIQLESGSTATAYAPFSNICPISGWTGVKVTRTGKELLDFATNPLIQGNWGVAGSMNHVSTANKIRIKGGQSYTLKHDKTTVYHGQYIRFYDSNETLLDTGITSYSSESLTFTAQNNASYIRINFYHANGITPEQIYSIHLSLRLSSQTDGDADYEGQTYDITFPSEAGTVYGGSLTVNEDGTGTLMVDRAEVDLGSLNWTYRESITAFSSSLFGYKKAASGSDMPNILSSAYKTVPIVTMINTTIENDVVTVGRQNTWDNFVLVRNKDYTDAASFKAVVTGQQLVYELATPVSYALTALEVLETLKCVNNIWADTGDTTVTYRADTKTYVDSKEPEIPVQDVQVNGVSVLSDGVANVPVATDTNLGVVKTGISNRGIGILADGSLLVSMADQTMIKQGFNSYRPIVPNSQHLATFYGLAKAAGADMASLSSTTVGVYPEAQKSAISTMLSGSVSVSGTTPTINALPGVRYVCGEVSTLDVTVPASGIIDVVFESGSTATVLTITGTVKWANGFDPTNLDANTTYEINIADGLGVAASWT